MPPDEKNHLLLQLIPFLIVILVVKKNLLVDPVLLYRSLQLEPVL